MNHNYIALKHCFYTRKIILKLFCFENDLAKNFAKSQILFKCFVWHITVILKRIHFYTMWKIKFSFMKCFSGARLNQI